MNQPGAVVQTHAPSATHPSVVRNSFILLALVLGVATVGAGIGLFSGLTWSLGMWILFMVAFIGGPFAIRAVQGQAAIGMTFAWAGLIGFLLSPMVSAYASLPGGSTIVLNALATTAILFTSLAAYAVVSRKDFSFLGSFIFAGLIVVLIAIVANLFLRLPMLSVTISAVAVMLMSGLILYDVSRLIRDGASSAIDIVVSLFANIVVLFSHLLSLFSFFGGED